MLGHFLSSCDDGWVLPNIYDLFSRSLRDPKLDLESGPRCSLAEALTGPDGQDLFVDAALAKMGMNLIWHLLTKGQIDRHGVQVDVRTLDARPMLIDPEAWAFFGYRPEPERVPSGAALA